MKTYLHTVGCACGYCGEVADLHRAAMVRLVTSQQWAVACATMYVEEPNGLHLIPCADDVVAEALGER